MQFFFANCLLLNALTHGQGDADPTVIAGGEILAGARRFIECEFVRGDYNPFPGGVAPTL